MEISSPKVLSGLMIIFIPAKGQSQEIKNKNLRRIGKKSLLKITIDFAKKISKDIYVSSENKNIIKFARENSCKVHIRERKIANQEMEMKYIIKDFIKKLKLKKEIILILQPTSPFRNTRYINEAIKIIKNNYKINSVISINKADKKYLKSLEVYSSGKIKNNERNKNIFKNRQNLESLYVPNGNFFIFRTNKFLVYNEIPIIGAYGLNIHYPYFIDIDSFIDLKKCREIYRKSLLKNNKKLKLF